MSAGNHDTLVYRLAQMLVKLNQGETLDPQALADEFGVNLRTIQRDLNERFAYLPLVKTNGRYHLDPTFLGKLSTRDIERFASLAGVRGLFPSLSDDFLRDIFDTRIQSALLVKGHHYENLAGKEAQFRLLEQAIVARHHVSFDYQKDEARSITARSHRTSWSITKVSGTSLAVMQTRSKHSPSARSSASKQLDTQFDPDPNIEKTLSEDDGIWLSEEKNGNRAQDCW